MNENTGTLTINVAAVVANWRTVAAHAHPSITSAVIKADAYGLGAAQIGSELYRAGCRHFFFATFTEALNARAGLGADSCCYLLGGVPAGAEAEAVRCRLIPVLSSMAAVERWLKWRASAGLDAAEAPAAVKFDTGMTRLGLALSELEALLADRESWLALSPVLLMSHLAVSDETHNPQNRRQRDLFFALGARVKQLQPSILLSLANSCGIYLGRDYHADLVRPGAALYGFNPVPEGASPVSSVASLTLPVIALRTLKASAQVGYGAQYQAKPGQVLAVAAGGYADGLHRILGRNGYGFCRGARVPVVGRVSMDSTIFDVSAAFRIDGKQEAAESLVIEVMNTTVLTLDALSERNQALGYEVLTSLRSGRYRREYQSEAL
ncbi:alanine racemase [Gilvimarinus polysaccharolyticus]|uniref:alanine racemase n=1 Tax=Gilvimarinus polysaccharolyticus TaxID=863921 RepID=UPI0006735E6E|nr:alanine racemase [Gilvimarinus polysaccharolyticus]